mmetsp:Transcript_27948/g.23112  ORF Transcript_27948/g.23112 Transcript_27948/m.23112 type:complete len:94 (-) Transcript_27948:32-313(-)
MKRSLGLIEHMLAGSSEDNAACLARSTSCELNCLVLSQHNLLNFLASLRDSYLEDGFILEKRIGTGMPKKIEDCKVMIANTTTEVVPSPHCWS